jgi:hypothetical protein
MAFTDQKITNPRVSADRYKNANGVYFLKELFFEYARDRANAVYTLKDEDHTVDGVTYPSLRARYIASKDPTEYRFAIENLYGWEHWQVLSNCTWMQPFVAKWRDELNVLIRSEALATVIRKAASTDKDAVVAAKYIEDQFGEGKAKNTRGRPSKAEVHTRATELAREQSRLAEDFNRLTSIN